MPLENQSIPTVDPSRSCTELVRSIRDVQTASATEQIQRSAEIAALEERIDDLECFEVMIIGPLDGEVSQGPILRPFAS